jgi:hypothetical protein
MHVTSSSSSSSSFSGVVEAILAAHSARVDAPGAIGGDPSDGQHVGDEDAAVVVVGDNVGDKDDEDDVVVGGAFTYVSAQECPRLASLNAEQVVVSDICGSPSSPDGPSPFC